MRILTIIALTCGFTSRLRESNPGPTHYERTARTLRPIHQHRRDTTPHLAPWASCGNAVRHVSRHATAPPFASRTGCRLPARVRHLLTHTCGIPHDSRRPKVCRQGGARQPETATCGRTAHQERQIRMLRIRPDDCLGFRRRAPRGRRPSDPTALVELSRSGTTAR
jgi:hypothetical protein